MIIVFFIFLKLMLCFKKNNWELDIWYFCYRCDGPNDDPFRACFGCEENLKRSSFFDNYTNYFYNDFIDRQTGERFRATRQSRRLICSNRRDRNFCRIRVDRAMELRSRSYMRSLQFIQSEEYLSADDLDILRYHIV